LGSRQPGENTYKEIAVSEDKLQFPLPEDRLGEVVHLFQAVTPPDPVFNVEVAPNEICDYCRAERQGLGDPVVVLFSTDGQLVRVYCDTTCLIKKILSLVQGQQPAEAAV
jgi:hypothetical protein